MCSLFRLLVGLSTLGGLLLIGSILVAAAAPNPPHVITLHEGKLSVHVTGMPLREVLAEVSRLSHTELVWLSSEGQEELVSVEFTGLSLLQGLERILQRRNFLLFYVPQPSGTHVTQLWIASNRQPTKPPPPTQVAVPPPSPAKDKAPKVAQAGSVIPANKGAMK